MVLPASRSRRVQIDKTGRITDSYRYLVVVENNSIASTPAAGNHRGTLVPASAR
jgi:hypothetical protein